MKRDCSSRYKVQNAKIQDGISMLITYFKQNARQINHSPIFMSIFKQVVFLLMFSKNKVDGMELHDKKKLRIMKKANLITAWSQLSSLL